MARLSDETCESCGVDLKCPECEGPLYTGRKLLQLIRQGVGFIEFETEGGTQIRMPRDAFDRMMVNAPRHIDALPKVGDWIEISVSWGDRMSDRSAKEAPWHLT